MMTRKTTEGALLASCALIGLVACQDAATYPEGDPCAGKCDGLQDVAKLMPRAPETPGTIALTRNQDSWYFEVIGAKGEIVLLSEEYATRASALNGALSVEENGVVVDRYLVQEEGGAWSFVLRAANNQVIGDGKMFATEAEAEQAALETRELIAGIVQYKAALTAGARFELDRDQGNWKFELLDENEEPVLKSQIYSRRRDAITGIESVRKNGKDLDRYVLLESPHRFILKAKNGVEIAESGATFASAQAAQAAVSSTQALLTSERVANPW